MSGWFHSVTKCRVCGHRQVSVVPVGADETALECANCHFMACEPIEWCGDDDGREVAR